MKRIVDRGLVALALRRSLSPGVVVWSALLLGLVLWTGETAHAVRDAGSSADEAARIAAGLARERVWLAFVLGVVPLLVVRTVSSVAPWRVGTQPESSSRRGAAHAAAARHDDSPWLATRAVSNACIATSTWLGATLAGLGLLTVFAVAADRQGGGILAPMPCGSIAGPQERWAAESRPLEWNAEMPQGIGGEEHRVRDRTARIRLGLGAGAGIATEVRLHARRADGGATPRENVTTTRIGNRGTAEVGLPEGRGDVHFVLECPGREARVRVLSERVELWSYAGGPHAATFTVALRLALALCAWLAIALGFSPFVSHATATLGVLAAWVPLWWGSGASLRSLPGADLLESLALLGDGRAPAMPPLLVCATTAGVIVLGLVLTWIGLRRWRVSA